MQAPPEDVSQDMFVSSSNSSRKPNKPVTMAAKSSPSTSTSASTSTISSSTTAVVPDLNNMSAEEVFAKMGITSFGKKDIPGKKTIAKPSPPQPSVVPSSVVSSAAEASHSTKAGAELDDESDDEVLLRPYAKTDVGDPSRDGKFPVANNIVLKGHEKCICALALDVKGSRLITGSYDFKIRFWDFAGMSSNALRSFREIDPTGEFHGAYTYNQIAWNVNGNMFALCRAHAQPLLYDREGSELYEFCKGDQYVTDMAHTKGHTAEVTGCEWSRNEPEVVLTGGKDSTLRLWHSDRLHKRNTTIIKTAQGVARWRRAMVTCCGWSPSGNTIYAGCDDGSIMLWPAEGPYLKPGHLLQGAHVANMPITSICMTGNNRTLVSRGGDGTLKIWDVRAFTKPLAEFRDLETAFDHVDVCLSPDQNTVVTGTSVPPGGLSYGELRFFSLSTLQPVYTHPVSKASVVRVLWHHELNQILVGSHDSHCYVFYDPAASRKGALLCAQKFKKVDAAESSLAQGVRPDIRTPNALPMYKETSWKSTRKRESSALVPDKSGLPTWQTREMAMFRPSTKHDLLLKQGITKNTIRQEDPVEKLRQYAKEAAEQPLYVGHVYEKTQPKPIFATEDSGAADPAHPIFGGDRSAKKQKILDELKVTGAAPKVRQ